MKTINLILGLMLTSTLILSAQSPEKAHPITKKSFTIQLNVQKNGTLKVVSFVSFEGEKRSAKIVHAGELAKKELKPGTVIEGTFRFNSFASEGGLGTTRIAKGKGKGYLKISNIIATEVNPMISKLAGVGDMAIRIL